MCNLLTGPGRHTRPGIVTYCTSIYFSLTHIRTKAGCAVDQFATPLNQQVHRSLLSFVQINSIKSSRLHNNVRIMTPAGDLWAGEATIDWPRAPIPARHGTLYFPCRSVINDLMWRDRWRKTQSENFGPWLSEHRSRAVFCSTALEAAALLRSHGSNHFPAGFDKSGMSNKVFEWKTAEMAIRTSTLEKWGSEIKSEEKRKKKRKKGRKKETVTVN